MQRDRRNYTPTKLRESTTVVGLSQSRLREQVEGLVTRLNSQLVQKDPAFEKIIGFLPQAIEAMKGRNQARRGKSRRCASARAQSAADSAEG